MVLIIFAFPISESLVAFVALRTDYNTLRCYSDKGQLSVAIQCAAVLSKQGATFRCHSERRSVISNKGQHFVAMQCPSDKGQFSIAMDPRLRISRVGSVLVEQWSFAKIVFENFYWGWLIFSKSIPFSKLDHFLDPKEENIQCSWPDLHDFKSEIRTSALI